jgi:hypothetical protein
MSKRKASPASPTSSPHAEKRSKTASASAAASSALAVAVSPEAKKLEDAVDYLKRANLDLNKWLLRPLWLIVAAYVGAPPVAGAFIGACRTYWSDDKTLIKQHTGCWLVHCAAPVCARAVCIYHGWGDAENEGAGPGTESYDSRRCRACHKHFCRKHYRNQTTECDRCNFITAAEASLGMYNRRSDSRFCADHAPVPCSQRKNSEAGSGAEEDEEEVGGCGALCCADCIPQHVCGEDELLDGL